MNTTTDNEAAAVEAACIAYAKEPSGSIDMVPEERRVAKMRAAIAAHTAALREQPDKPIDEAVRAFEEHFQESSEDPSMEGELEIWLTAWQAAHTAPPATVPADALRDLVEKCPRSVNGGIECVTIPTSIITDLFSKGADHEQR